jgi:CheY-like chemotaxis protein
LKATRKGDDVEIIVSDSGIGIRAEFLPHIFERFRQAEAGSSRAYGGLGLGLAIAKQLVEMHRGTLTVASEGVGRGSVFTVTLPLPERVLYAEDFRAPGDERVQALAGLDILLVEDEADAGATIRGLLEEHGAQVRLVESAAAARESLRIKSPDVILSDIGLPGEDGYSLMRSLRLHGNGWGNGDIPAIALTAFARPEDRDAALEAGFAEHPAKPLEEDRLLQLLDTFVKRRKPS